MTKRLLTVLAIAVALATCKAQTTVTTNAIKDNPMAESLPLPNVPLTSVSNILTSVPGGVTQVAQDGYNFYLKLSLTNPVSFGVFGLRNGGGYGGGLEVNEVRSDSAVNAGFAMAGIQTETVDPVTGLTKRKLDFYDATINLSVSTVETIPVLNIPITLRIFSGPFFSLNGGVLMGAQSGTSGDVNIRLGKSVTHPKYLTLGAGVVNCAGAAAAGLKPVMPMGHLNLTVKF